MKQQKRRGSYIDQITAKKLWERRHFDNMILVCILYVLHAEFGFGHKRLMDLQEKFNKVTGEAVDKFDDLAVAKMQQELKERCGLIFTEADGTEMRF
jgi:hypothetical protein